MLWTNASRVTQTSTHFAALIIHRLLLEGIRWPFGSITGVRVTGNTAIRVGGVVVALISSACSSWATSILATNPAHVDILLHFEGLDVNATDRARVVQYYQRLRLDVKLVVATGPEVAASDRQNFLDHFPSQIIVDQVALAFESDQDGVGAVKWHYFCDERLWGISWRTIHITEIHLWYTGHLQAAILGPHELFHGKVPRVLKDSKHAWVA